MMKEVNVVEQIPENHETIAVVGVSPDPAKPSYRVARRLIDRGYRVYFVNPTEDEIMGRPSYPDLASIPEPVSVVNVFRRPDQVMPVIDEAVAIGARTVWLQPGTFSEAAAARAREAGLTVVVDKCICSGKQSCFIDEPDYGGESGSL
jgi:predicted CoA-binding protein